MVYVDHPDMTLPLRLCIMDGHLATGLRKPGDL